MAVTGLQLYTEISLCLIESPTDGSADYTDGLYTRAEIMARINYRQEEFNKRTGVYVTNDSISSITTGDTNVALPSDIIDVVDVAVNAPDASIGFTNVPKGSVYEVDIFTTNEATTTPIPTVYTLEDSNTLSMRIFPPTSSANATARFCYTPKPPALPSPPDSTALVIPDDLTPFVKYGALGDLFGKTGETYDPMREQVCKQLYELGIETARAWVSGAQS